MLSAKENIADDASGILVEGVLESMAEYYSAELSQKIHRGMSINAEKCLSNGSNPGLGFKVDAERRFYVDEEEAAIVREIYERYASGETKAEIIRDLKRRRVKTSLGKEFSPNSLSHLLSNKRYIGVYLYKGKETPGGMPRILDDDLFYRVQSMMNKTKCAGSNSRRGRIPADHKAVLRALQGNDGGLRRHQQDRQAVSLLYVQNARRKSVPRRSSASPTSRTVWSTSA